jgi:hypothetical protein
VERSASDKRTLDEIHKAVGHAQHLQRVVELGGNAHRNYVRYLPLAREAASTGDRVEMENCYQHADHYSRVMNDRG